MFRIHVKKQAVRISRCYFGLHGCSTVDGCWILRQLSITCAKLGKPVSLLSAKSRWVSQSQEKPKGIQIKDCGQVRIAKA